MKTQIIGVLTLLTLTFYVLLVLILAIRSLLQLENT